jgi:uncharacterized protein (DUF488 family)
LDELVRLLKAHDILCLTDVRSFPGSRRHPHFSRETLSGTLPGEGIAYEYLGKQLGGLRNIAYEEHVKSDTFRSGLRELERLAHAGPTVFMCAEKMPWQCHRRYIGQELMKRGWQVIHILDEDTIWDPEQPLMSHSPDS